MALSDKMTRREFLKNTIKSAAVLSGSFFYYSCKKHEEKLKIGYIPITDASALLIAHANGYFKDEGLKVEPPVLIRSWSSLVEAFIADKVNVVHLLLPISIWMRYKNRVKVKVIAWAHTNGSAITVGANSKIREFSDLAGKRIAVPYWYSMHNIILQMGLKKFNLNPVIKPSSNSVSSNETNLLIMPPSEMPVALASNKIDAFIVAEPFNAMSELSLNAKIMRFTGDIWKNHPCCVVVMKEELIKNNPDFAQAVINAIVRAQQYLILNREESAFILSKDGNGYLPVTSETVRRVFLDYKEDFYNEKNGIRAIRHNHWNCNRIDFQPYPYKGALEFIYNKLSETIVEGDNSFLKDKNASLAAMELIDDSFVKKAIFKTGKIELFSGLNSATWDREETVII